MWRQQPHPDRSAKPKGRLEWPESVAGVARGRGWSGQRAWLEWPEPAAPN